MYGIESGKLPQQPSLMRTPDVQTPTSPGHAHARSRQKQKIDVATGPIPALNPVRAVQTVRGPEARMCLSVRLPRPLPVLCSCVYTKAGRRYLAYKTTQAKKRCGPTETIYSTVL